MYRCVLCASSNGTAQYSAVDELEVHIASDHCQFLPFECEKCRFAKFPTEFALASHCELDHGLTEYYIRYKVTPETKKKRAEVKDLLEKSLKLNTDHTNSRTDREHVLNNGTFKQTGLCNHGSASDKTSQGGIMPMLKKQSFIEDYLVDSSTNNDLSINTMEPMSSSHVVNATAALTPFDGPAIAVFTSNCDKKGVAAADFFDRSASSPAEVAKNRVICVKCGMTVSTQRICLLYHANRRHAHLTLFHCMPCNRDWQTYCRSDIMKHVKAMHGGDMSVIVDNRRQNDARLRSVLNQCFPNTGGLLNNQSMWTSASSP